MSSYPNDSVENGGNGHTSSSVKPSRAKRFLTGLGLVALSWLLIAQGTFLLTNNDISQGRLTRASKRIRWCQLLSPWDDSWNWLTARLARRRGDHEAWTALINRQSVRNPGSTKLKIERELMRIQSGAPGADSPIHVERLIMLGADASDIAEALFLGHISQQDPDQAQVALAWWDGLKSRQQDANVCRGLLARMREDEDLARETFESVLSVCPKHEMARLQLADLLLDVESPESALRHYLLAAQEAPLSVQVRVGTARCLRRLGNWDTAELILKQLRDVGPPAIEVLMESGQIALERGEYERAVSYLNAGLKLRPPTHDERTTLALIYSLQGHPADGLPFIQQNTRIESLHKQLRDLQVASLLEPENSNLHQKLQSLNDELRRAGT